MLSVARVGETITFSAGILIAALLSLATASFSLYSGLAAPLAIAIGLMLIAGLTLLPALLAIIGPVAFWPSPVRPGTGRAGWWGPACARIVRRPVATLVAGLIVFGALAVAGAGYVAAGFGGAATAPAGSDSALGNALLAAHFPQTAANPTVIVLRLRQPAWTDPGPVAAAGRQLAADPQFTAVSGPLDANGTALSPAQYAALAATYGPPRALAAAAARARPAGAAGRLPGLPGQRIVRERGRHDDLVRDLAGGRATRPARRPRRRCPPSAPRPPARPPRPGPRRTASPGRRRSPTTSPSCPTATCAP